MFVCKFCSNGCMLTVARRDCRVLLVSGNRCPKGVAYAHLSLKDRESGMFLPAESSTYSPEIIARVLACYGLILSEVQPGVFIQGSPERAAFRTVVSVTAGARYVVEQLHPGTEIVKRTIARRVADCVAEGLPVIPYLLGIDGEAIQVCDGLSWQVCPFPAWVALDRLTYWRDAWRGESLARVLLELYRIADARAFDGPTFSLPTYVRDLASTIKHQQPELHTQLVPYLEWFEDVLFAQYEALPCGFCHGDPHPMNVLWGDNRIVALIDFEFSGIKPRMYDAALIVGCVGAEAPEALNGPLVTKFIDVMTENAVIDSNRKQEFFAFVAALRFAWLSEWLRREDEEMVGFELFYLEYLKNQGGRV